jgi:hypothetical protein
LSIFQGTGTLEAVRNIIPASSDNLQSKEIIIGDGEHRRRYIFCYNPLDAERQRLHREEIVRLLEEDLACHHDRTATAGRAIQLLVSKLFMRYKTTSISSFYMFKVPRLSLLQKPLIKLLPDMLIISNFHFSCLSSLIRSGGK